MVTGSRLLMKNALHVRPERSSPVLAAKAGSKSLITKPMGTKYIFATLCSNPAATKAVMGKIIAAILSTVLRALNVSQTARQTRILQSTPRARACQKPNPTLALAMLRAVVPIPPFEPRYCLLAKSKPTIASDPTKFPT